MNLLGQSTLQEPIGYRSRPAEQLSFHVFQQHGHVFQQHGFFGTQRGMGHFVFSPHTEHRRHVQQYQLLRQTTNRSVATIRPAQFRLAAPVQFLHKLLATWRLGEREAVVLLGFDEAEISAVRDLLEGRAELKGRDLKDRIVCLYQIRKTLHSLFRDEQVENKWLRQRHDSLDGERPMDLLLHGSMENLLVIKDYVEIIAGL